MSLGPYGPVESVATNALRRVYGSVLSEMKYKIKSCNVMKLLKLAQFI